MAAAKAAEPEPITFITRGEVASREEPDTRGFVV